jgi:hypothetical protein
MRQTTAEEEREQLAFATEAARHFKSNPECATFSDEIRPGGFLAIRWGMLDDGVLVVRLDEGHEPTNYSGIIKGGA